MNNQGFGILGLFLLPFYPLIWFLDLLSTWETVAEIQERQSDERSRLKPNRGFIITPASSILNERGRNQPAAPKVKNNRGYSHLYE